MEAHVCRFLRQMPWLLHGPGAADKSWTKPVQKYLQRVTTWAPMNLGLCLNIMIYRTFISSVLSFIMQLEPLPESIMDSFEKALRKLAPGPGSWASMADLCNLESAYKFRGEFRDPRWTALASKLRVVETVAKDCKQRRDELLQLQTDHIRRPFPLWHKRCYYAVLADTEDELASKGVTRERVRRKIWCEDRNERKSFQWHAETLIRRVVAAPYFRRV